MQSTSLSATALEKLKRRAKSLRDSTGQPLSEALEFVAHEAGFSSWKQVTTLAASHKPSLMPAAHRHLLVWVANGSPRMRKCSTVEELCDALGGIEPVLFRSHCDKSQPGARCLCEMDPFVMAKRANVAVDIGDKYDFWTYLYVMDKPYGGLNLVNVRVSLGLGSHGYYINEHLLDSSNDSRSNSLNPNNPAHAYGLNNRSNQLNPNNERFKG